jgi:hypothetical protein
VLRARGVMPALVELRLPDGSTTTLGPGAVIGRAFTAELQLHDARISEAHAQVSLRGGELVLIALRGRVRVGGREVPRVTLSVGQSLELAVGVALQVVDVELPDRVLGVEAEGVPRQVLSGVVSVCVDPGLHLVSGLRPDARAQLFSDGLAWYVGQGAGPAVRVRAGETITVAGHVLRFLEVSLGLAETPDTTPVPPGLALRLTCHDDVVHVWPAEAREPVLISGQPASAMRALLAEGKPLRWEALAARLWPGDEADDLVRHRLDVLLGKLRRRLEAGGVRRDLVTAHRNGCLELVLYPGDQAHDRGSA